MCIRDRVKCAAKITVNTFEKDIEKYCEQIYYFDRRRKQKVESEYYVLRMQYEYMYREDMGLQFEVGEDNNCEKNCLLSLIHIYQSRQPFLDGFRYCFGS